MNWRRYLLLALLGLVLSAGIAAFQPAPGYMDADYYYAGGLQLAAGRGFTEPFLWNYLDDPAGLPHPAFSYWMPLTSLLAALGMTLTGHANWFAARLGFLALGAILPPLTAALSYSLISRRDLALTAGLLAVFSGFYAPYLPVTDTFGLYMLFGALFFLIVNRQIVNRKSSIANGFLLGLLAGLMHLSRADGVLWLLLALFAVILQKPSSLPPNYAARFTHYAVRITQHASRITFCLLGYLLIISPWLVRNLAVFGAPLAPGGSRALWLTRYDQLFAYPASLLTFASWWHSGLAEILKVRLWALGLNLESALAVQGSIFLLPLILIGLWQLRRESRGGPCVRPTCTLLALLAWGLTLAAMTLVFPFAGARGGFFHSGAALQPFWWAVAPLGLARVVAWGARRRGWQEKQAHTIFSAGMVVIAALLTAWIVQGRVIGAFNGEQAWGREAAAYSQIEEFLVEQGAPVEAVVVVANPPGYYLASGRPAVAVPDGDEQTVLDVARKYGGRFLILEQGSLPRGLARLYDQPIGQPDFRFLGEVAAARIYVIQP
ncbi:MAG: hypothetical protein COY47_02990 [Chloroflexi bacterium CG_4_10_14_0_8_um_filter_57_5]|nr:MAG: hypothetical protein COY47_02990 [Chloroflexi bacterium CG_4_10_14_0_8_um_filter_57_5]